MENRSVLELLKSTLGENKVLCSLENLYVYGFDATPVYRGKPMAVIRAYSTEDVMKVLTIANDYAIPVVPRGHGTSLTGAVIPVEGGLILDLSPMKRIEVDVENGIVAAEAGATIGEVNAECRKYGFFFPPDPASAEVATVGGALATDAGGMRGARYGTMRNWVLAMKVVVPGGRVLRLGAPVYKWRCGLNLLHLFVGSEGTLGVITEATLKMLPLPEKIVRLLALFETVDEAVTAICSIRRRALNPLILELLDESTIKSVNEVFNLNMPEVGAAVIADVDGPKEAVERLGKEMAEVFEECGAISVRIASDEAEMEKLYAARRGAYPAVSRLYPIVLIEDIVVPLSKLAEAIRRIKELSSKYGVAIVVFGHAGDGNIHPCICMSSRDEESMRLAEKVFYEICRIAIELGGTVSGEHGIGLQKVHALVEELKYRESSWLLEVMREVKKVFDPKGIMNPGKFFMRCRKCWEV